MAWRLDRPLVTVACHEDLSAGNLIGRWLLDGDGTRWQDGPLTLAARFGGISYLDELVEARANTTVVIHPLTDTRRMLPIAPRNDIVHAHPNFQLVVSYNPTPASPMRARYRRATRRPGQHPGYR
jgi:nitric oxide reductase NorQ protein